MLFDASETAQVGSETIIVWAPRGLSPAGGPSPAGLKRPAGPSPALAARLLLGRGSKAAGLISTVC